MKHDTIDGTRYNITGMLEKSRINYRWDSAAHAERIYTGRKVMMDILRLSQMLIITVPQERSGSIWN
jgi:hypothetical protein